MAGGSIAATTVPRARHTSFLVHCICGVTVAIEGVTGSRCCTAGGRIQVPLSPEQDTAISCFFHSIREQTAAIKGT